MAERRQNAHTHTQTHSLVCCCATSKNDAQCEQVGHTHTHTKTRNWPNTATRSRTHTTLHPLCQSHTQWVFSICLINFLLLESYLHLVPSERESHVKPLCLPGSSPLHSHTSSFSVQSLSSKNPTEGFVCKTTSGCQSQTFSLAAHWNLSLRKNRNLHSMCI